MAEDFIIEEQTDAPPQGDPLEKLYKGLVSDGKYTKSFDDFKQKYSSKADIDFLYSGLSADKDYTKSKDDFYDQYFPSVKKKETFNSGNPHSYLNLFGKKSEQPSGISSPTQSLLPYEGTTETNNLPSTSTLGFTATDARVGGEERFKNEKIASPKALGKAALLGLSTVASGTLKSIGIASKRLDFFNEYKDKKAEELGTYKAGKWIDDQVKDLVGDLTPEEQNNFSVKLASGIGQMGGFFLGGAGSKVLKMSQGLSTAALGAATLGSSEYENAIQKGATPDEAAKVFWINTAIGTTEALPIMSAFRKLDKYTGGLATGALAQKLASTVGGRITNEIAQGFITEAAQEATQQLMTNVAAKNTYDATRSIWDGVVESGALGGIIGSTMTGALSAIREKRAMGNLSPEEDADLAKAESFAEQKLKEVAEGEKNANHLEKVKENLSDKNLPEEHKDAYAAESLKEKIATDKAEKLTDPTLIKQQKEIAKEAHETKEQILAGVKPEDVVTDKQKKEQEKIQKDIEEKEKAKIEVERLTIDKKFDLEKIDSQIEETDGRESEQNRIKLKELNEEKRRINEDYENAVKKLTPKEESKGASVILPSEGKSETETKNGVTVIKPKTHVPEPEESDPIKQASEAALTDINIPEVAKLFSENPEQGLKEAAEQLNASEGEAQTARKFYGDTISDIALKLYPKEKVPDASTPSKEVADESGWGKDSETTTKALEDNIDNKVITKKQIDDIIIDNDLSNPEKNGFFDTLGQGWKDAIKRGDVDSKQVESLQKAYVSNQREKILSESYHKAKADGSNPELVKAVESLFPSPTPQAKEPSNPPSKTVSEVGDGGKTEKKSGVSVIMPSENKQNVTTIKPKTEEKVGKPPTEGEPPKPPKPPKETKGAEGEGMEELDKLANNVPDSGEVAKYMSKETIEKYTGESPQNDQTRGVQELEIALQHGEKIIQKAQELFGKDYVDKTLEYIENSKAGISNKALMYVSLENALGREKLGFLEDANKVRELTKQQALVYEQSQKFAREYSLALNYQKLRRIAQVGYDIEKITDNFFSAEEIEAKGKLKEAIEADADAINEEAQKQATTGMTPEVESKIAEGVEKEINKIYESLPSEKKTRAEKLIKALEQVQKKLRGRTYDATLGIPVAIVDAGITTIKHAIKLGASIADAVEAGIKKIKEKLSEHEDWKGKVWENEKQFREDAIEEFKKFAPDVKNIVKEALIKAGFGRTINVKGEEKQLLDWKKLAGRAGTVSKISENVAEVFKKEGKSAEEVDRIKDELVKEYIDLRASVIEKAQNEIAKRNKETVAPEQKSAAKKLAELYTYGLFEKNSVEFETAINKALGAKVSEQGFKDAREIAHAMEIIYANSFKGIKLNDISAKAAIERLEDKMRILLFREAKKQGNTNLKLANFVRNYFEIQQTMLLNNMKQAVENPFSGLQQKIIENLNTLAAGNTTTELSKQNRKLMKDVFKDMVLKGGFGYGKVESQFVNRQHIDDYVNKLSDNELYHAITSVVTGKATLNAMDAMFKAGLTEKKFTHNLITILTHETNPNKMSKKDALKYVSEKLTGQSFKDAQKTSKQIIEQINKDAGKDLIPTNQEMIDRFANDIVKASLEMGGKVTAEQIKAAYGAAYKAAGLGIGHEANNILSSQMKGYGARIEGEINNAIKNKEWNRAAALTYKGVLFRNILNPFVGGGTNWLVLKLEKTGLGLFTGLAYKIGSKQDIDLSSKTGLARLEARLYNQSRWKDNIMRGFVGGVVTWGSYGLALALMNTDDYEEWRKKNRWASRYLDVITPEPMLTRMALTNGDQNSVKQYVGQSFNRNDAFSKEAKGVKTLGYIAKGESDKSWGAAGELVGSFFNAPLPWRLAKDNQVLYQGIKGQDPYHGDYKPSSGFFNGYFQGGVIEYLGFRPNRQVEAGDGSFNNEILKADYERTKNDEQKKNYFVANKVQPKITVEGEEPTLTDKEKETFVKDVETERDKLIDDYFKTRTEEYKQLSDLERSKVLDELQEGARTIAVDKFFKANPDKLEEVKKKIQEKVDQVKKEREERSQ